MQLSAAMAFVRITIAITSTVYQICRRKAVVISVSLSVCPLSYSESYQQISTDSGEIFGKGGA